jgi:hypothetical protein
MKKRMRVVANPRAEDLEDVWYATGVEDAKYHGTESYLFSEGDISSMFRYAERSADPEYRPGSEKDYVRGFKSVINWAGIPKSKNPSKRGSIHERIAEALGWSVADVRSFSLPSLRDMVRPDHPKLAHEIDESIRSGGIVKQTNRKPALSRLASRLKNP